MGLDPNNLKTRGTVPVTVTRTLGMLEVEHGGVVAGGWHPG